jgi:hypothetical protein
MTGMPRWRNQRLEDRPGRLAGRYVFLSASVPYRDLDVYRKPEWAHLDIEEAVVSLARAVFAEEGRLVFGGHPSISPLVASVAADYYPVSLGARMDAEAPVSVYQSSCYEGYIPDTTRLLREMGLAEIVWTGAEEGERYDPLIPGRQCVQSIFHMRDQMLKEKNPVAMVAIGGMDGVEDEASRFLSRRDIPRPVYVFRSTWGAAARLAESRQPGLIVAEDRWRKIMPPSVEEGRYRQRAMVPYALIMQQLVGEIASLI